MGKSSRVALLLSLGLIGISPGACLSERVRLTQWPPDDFFLDLSYARDGRERQRVRVWGDGLMVYTEATDWLLDPQTGAPIVPVFGRVCAYRLHPMSARQLSRELERVGLYDLSRDEDGTEASPERVAVAWRMLRDERSVAASGAADGSIARALHVVNSYLPPDVGVRWDNMPGEPLPQRASRVPAPVTDLEGALDVHIDLVDIERSDRALREQAFALALVVGDRAGARTQLAGLAAAGAPATELLRLRGLLAAAQPPLFTGGGGRP